MAYLVAQAFSHSLDCSAGVAGVAGVDGMAGVASSSGRDHTNFKTVTDNWAPFYQHALVQDN